MSDLNRFRRDITALKAKMLTALEKALPSILKPVKTRAKAISPVDTGRLRASIDVTTTGLKGILKADTPYASYVENRIPYLNPAVEQSEKQIISSLEEVLQRTIYNNIED